MIKAIIFDCFGVVFTDDFAKLYKHFGGDIEKDKDFIEDVFFRAAKGTIKHGADVLAPHLGVSVKEWDDYYEKIRDFDRELLNYTNELRKKYRVSMLSNISSRGLAFYMDYSVLEEHFEDIIQSYEIGYAKPESRAYEIAAERLGVRLDECVFIDDRQQYIEGAQHVGMKTILYTDFDSFKKELRGVLAS